MGDKVLLKAAVILIETIMGADTAGRFCVDKSVLISVETKMKAGIQAAGRLQAAIQQTKIPHKRP
ncbi:MAG: diguanylate cyclase [Nitrospirae bacterium]|nr:diguanylate cyclase [Nitrospirota bacterium]